MSNEATRLADAQADEAAIDRETAVLIQDWDDADDKPQVDATQKQATDSLAANQTTDIAPEVDGYDYVSATKKGYLPAPDGEGNVRMPVEHFQPDQQIYGGYDLATGDKRMNNSIDNKIAEQDAEMDSHIRTIDDMTKQMTDPESGFKGLVPEEYRVNLETTAKYMVNSIANDVVMWAQQGRENYVANMPEVGGLADAVIRNVSPEKLDLPDVTVTEGLIGEFGRFMIEYRATGGLGGGNPVTKLGRLENMAARDAAVMFFQDPSQGNLVDVARSFGYLTDEQYDEWSASDKFKEGDITDARLNAVATDSVVITALSKTLGAIAQFGKSFKGKVAGHFSNVSEEAAQQSKGAYTGNQASLTDEGSTPGMTLRIGNTKKSVDSMAKKYRQANVDIDDFMQDMSGNGIPEEQLKEAWGAADVTHGTSKQTIKDEFMAIVEDVKTRTQGAQ